MNKEEKKKLVSELNQTFNSRETVVVVKQKGLTVAEMTDLRRSCFELDAVFKVAKNRLVKIALKDTKFEHLSDSFEGTTAITYSDDPISATKAVVTFAKKNNKLEIIAGGMGEKVLSAEDVKVWGMLPSLDELRAKMIGLLQAPGGQVARVLKAYSEKEN